ncbi:MAG: single-stranded DNA-binding protein [Oscillospiraceae bacterium]|nr:single-stranded DNA-binding protein [Oscillospiraceae bacterium]
MNQIVIMGRMTRDPELRQTPNGISVASFTLAVDRGFTPRDGGERQTDFIDVVAWRNTAEFVSKYFTKGQMAAVTGRLQIRDWTDKDGNKRRSAEVVADSIFFTESKRSREASLGQTESRDDYSSSFSTPVEGSDFAELDMDDGELPF